MPLSGEEQTTAKEVEHNKPQDDGKETTKLREKILQEKAAVEKLKNEKKDLDEENLENFLFRLAEESLVSIFPEIRNHDHSTTFTTADKIFHDDVEITKPSSMSKKKSTDGRVSLEEELKFSSEKSSSSLINENESTEIGITCGQRADNRIILRNFHDALSSEPRGKSNHLHMSDSRSSSAPSNDPEVSVSNERF